ncbi:MAG TPA: hypothetical protein ENI76_09675 [Ignavibacteria bacterium]|nr:hypothetical protein [Ignavibacteria bacterium]
MATIKETLLNGLQGLYYGNRVLLPFRADILKIIINDDILMDFSPFSKHIYLNETEKFTEIYFHDFKRLNEVVTKFETIKLVAVDKEDDLFNTDNHYKLALHLEEKHKLTIEKTDEDILFIE